MFLKFVVILLIGLVDLSFQCPRIITRREWGARSASTSSLSKNPPPFVVLHHTSTPACNSEDACRARMRQMQNYHMNTNKWSDIGYNFCIGNNGVVYEGRGWGKQGAHAPGYNSQSIGICMIGTFNSQLPSSGAINSAKALISCGVKLGKIKSNYWLIGHRQAFSTDCPGSKLFENIKKWPRFNANPKK